MMSEVGVDITESIAGKEILQTTVDDRNKCFSSLLQINHWICFLRTMEESFPLSILGRRSRIYIK